MLSKSKHVFVFLALSLLTACAGNTYNRVETGGTERTGAELDESGAILITTPRDGGYQGKITAGSGAVAARTIDAAFSRYAKIVDVYPLEYHSLAELKDTIAQNNYSYIVVPSLVTWTGKNTDWSRIPTHVNVKITVIDAATGKELSSNFLEGKGPLPSSVAAALNIDSDNPADIFADLADDYVDALYLPIPFLAIH